MINRILLTVFLSLYAGNAFAAISLISNTCTGTSQTGGTTTAINTTGASLIVVTTSDYNGIATISDNQSNTWSSIYTSPTVANNMYTDMWYVNNPTTSASHTITISGTIVYASICVAAFSGTATSSVLDQENGNSVYDGNGNTPTMTAGSVTPTQNNELVVTGVTVNQSAGYPSSINSGFTLLSPTVAQVNGSYYGGGMAYYVQSTAGAINPTWTASSSTYGMASTIETFKSSSTKANHGFTRFL